MHLTRCKNKKQKTKTERRIENLHQSLDDDRLQLCSTPSVVLARPSTRPPYAPLERTGKQMARGEEINGSSNGEARQVGIRSTPHQEQQPQQYHNTCRVCPNTVSKKTRLIMETQRNQQRTRDSGRRRGAQGKNPGGRGWG